MVYCIHATYWKDRSEQTVDPGQTPQYAVSDQSTLVPTHSEVLNISAGRKILR